MSTYIETKEACELLRRAQTQIHWLQLDNKKLAGGLESSECGQYLSDILSTNSVCSSHDVVSQMFYELWTLGIKWTSR